MKKDLTGLTRRYVKALQQFLDGGPSASVAPATTLGRQAVTMGIETLQMARIHERAFISCKSKSSTRTPLLVRRAGVFFTEFVTPIEETHRIAWQGRSEVKWKRETKGLAAANRKLLRNIVHFKNVASATKRSGDRYARLLKDSVLLQEGLRLLTHQALVDQESERQTISHKLQDEIAQTLLSINVRLLTLKSSANGNLSRFTIEIASTQKLVEDSIKSINRFARELKIRPPRSRDPLDLASL
ncbi:MAG TPA: hypothetical protein VK968_10665 [Roseimicrobium sp.]|nr:hypothetical protein [Roseimicrobium sp.]